MHKRSGYRANLTKMKAFFLLSYIANEQENKAVHPSGETLKYILNIIESALAEPGHGEFGNASQGYHADEVLEAIGNLLGCSEDNVPNFLTAGLLPILTRILDGPLYVPTETNTNEEEGPSNEDSDQHVILPNQYNLVEKRLAAKCCWALCFNVNARNAIASNIKLSRGMKYV